MKLSIIVPVFNRPEEIEELLTSLVNQTDSDFQLVIVEDGSTITCEDVCKKFSDKINIKYFYKPNTGRSDTRNYGMERAEGDYFIIFDSDVILPNHYIKTVRTLLTNNYADCFGGRDDAGQNFSPLQKAVNYSMTSFFTTGGIRAGKINLKSYHPRSFNMGFSRAVFETVGGYKNMIGEDIDLSIRIKAKNFKVDYFEDAYVYHKRRVSIKKYFKQVKTFGKGRIILSRMYKNTLKLIHLLPMFFVLSCFALVLLSTLSFLSPYFLLSLLPILFLAVLLFVDSSIRNLSIKIGFLSVITSFVQLFGYGLGEISEVFTGKAMKKTQEENYR